MIDELLGPLVFVGYVLVVGVALVLALLVFSTGGDEGSLGDGSPARRDEGDRSRSGLARLAAQFRSWWRRWR